MELHPKSPRLQLVRRKAKARRSKRRSLTLNLRVTCRTWATLRMMMISIQTLGGMRMMKTISFASSMKLRLEDKWLQGKESILSNDGEKIADLRKVCSYLWFDSYQDLRVGLDMVRIWSGYVDKQVVGFHMVMIVTGMEWNGFDVEVVFNAQISRGS